MPLFERRPVTETVDAIQLRWDNVDEVVEFICKKNRICHVEINEPSEHCSKFSLDVHYCRGSQRFSEGYWIFFTNSTPRIFDDATFRKTYQPKQQ